MCIHLLKKWLDGSRRPIARMFCAILLAITFTAVADAQTVAKISSQRNTPVLKQGLLVGVFSGGFNPANADRFESWIGRKSDFNVEFLTETAYVDHIKSDGTKVTDTLIHSGWLPALWAGVGRPDRNMLFSISLATKQDKSLANVAAGKYDGVFNGIASSIASKYPNAIIRIGWEFNADWYSWSAKGRAHDYISAFRHVSKIFKSYSSTFTIDWCPVHGFAGNLMAEQAYPGDDVVDVIGLDIYNDYRWGEYKNDPVKRWEWLRTHGGGLVWQQTFAAAHHKPMSLPEWGVNKDDPYFIEQMYNWITAHDYAYVAYWNSNSAFAGSLSNNQYPNAAARYKELFGALPKR